MINIKVLATSIMLIYGVDGHGECLTQSLIACEVLKKLGYKAKAVGGYHIKNFKTEMEDFLVFHAPIDQLPFDISNATITNNQENIVGKTWYHCWVETGDKIIDVNLHSVSHKKYTNIKKWKKENVLKGKEYYMPTDYNLYDGEIDARKINEVIETYINLLHSIPMTANCEEGPILIKKDGSWIPLEGYKLNKHIKPNTMIYAINGVENVNQFLEEQI